MSLFEIDQLRYNLNSLIELDNRDDSEIVIQIEKVLATLDSLIITKELIVQSKIALTISKIMSKTKNESIKKLSNDLFNKFVQIVKEKSHPQNMPNDKKLKEKEKFYKHFLNKLKEIDNDNYPKDPENIASQIAEKLEECDDPSSKFSFLINIITDKVKEESFNFKKKLLKGQLTVEEFVNLTTKDILTNSEKMRMNKIRETNMNKAMVPKPPQIVSKLYKCKKCKGNNVSFRQLQMLSADEPMTVIFFCGDCGATWKK